MNEREINRGWLREIVSEIPRDALRKVLLIINNPTQHGELVRRVFVEEASKMVSGRGVDAMEMYRLMVYYPGEKWYLSLVHFYPWRGDAERFADKIKENRKEVVVEIFKGTYWEALRECQLRNEKAEGVDTQRGEQNE